ncbi:MAG: Ku protein [Nitrososphaera sp.]
MAARSIWKGSISFGLVNIPIKLYSATESKEFSFNQLCENGHKIHYKRWCPVEEREVQWSNIKKGYEISKDKYVLLEKDELENVKLKTTKTIDIKEFIQAESLDPIFVEKSYYIAPDSKTVDKAYSLFVNVLRNTGKIGIGKVVLREKEHLVALRAYQRGLVMHQLHYQDEIKPIDEIKEITSNATAKIKIEEQEIELGKMLVDNLTSKDLDLGQYSDAYAVKLRELINEKARGKVHVIKEEHEEPESGKDLLEALKASVKQSKQKRG